MENYTQLWNEEVRDKKRTGRGVYSRTGSRGYVGKMMLTSDFLSGKEKREYMKSGKVRTYNMKDIVSYEEYLKFTHDEQKKLLETWRDNYSNEEIRNGMGVPKKVFYELVNNLGLKKKIGAIPKDEKITLSKQELEDYRDKMPEYELYKYIVPEQQEFLFNYHRSKHKTPLDFSKAWGVDPKIVYRIGSALRRKESKLKNKEKEKMRTAAMKLSKQQDKGKEEGLIEDSVSTKKNEEVPAPALEEVMEETKAEATNEASQETDTGIPNEVPVSEQDTISDKIDLPKTSVLNFESVEKIPKEKSRTMLFNIEEEVNAENLAKRLSKLAMFVEGESKIYEVKIEVVEKEENSNTLSTNEELVKQIAKLATKIS